ncbi:MAG: CHAT domain-containing protein [Bacteroidales bacterium]
MIFVFGLSLFTLFGYNKENGNPDSARIYNNKGIERYKAGDYEQAGILFQKSLKIKKEQQGTLSIDMATTYSNLGVVNRRLKRTENAMPYYDTAGYIFLNHHGPDHPWLGAVYQNQGNIMREQRDINSALNYYNNALRIFQKNGEVKWVASLYNNIGLAYFHKGDYKLAEGYFLTALETRKGGDPALNALPAGNLANCYKATGDIEQADHYYRMALDMISEFWGEDHNYFAINLMNYGLFLVTDAGEPDKGYEMLMKALDIHRTLYGDHGPDVARTYMNIGYYFELTGDYRSALKYHQKSLIANCISFNSLVITENPKSGEEVYSLDYMLASLKHKAFALYLLSNEMDKKANLEASLETYELAIEYIEKIRMGHHTEESQLLLSESEHETYMQAIHAAYKTYEFTGEKIFLEKAFIFSERSKAASLLSSIRDVEARSFGGVPEELLTEEKDIKRKIAGYRELIYEEQKEADADTANISFWQERVFSLELELRQLISRLKEEFPNYYSLKYNRDVCGIELVMDEIGSRDALVSYVDNDSLIYIFTVTKRSSDLYCVNKTSAFKQHIEELLDVLTSGNLDREVKDDYMTFTSTSRYFYNLLLEPVISGLDQKRLIIVPDGTLSYLPFDLLLSSDPEPDKINYAALKYLLRDFSVTYNYSATLWHESIVKESDFSGKILTLAPSYEFSEIPAPGTYSSRQYYRDKLMPLPGAREEAISIAGMMDGETLLDEEASEYKFKQIAGEYRLLHLAMHTLLDDENPMFSKLVFSDPENDQDDGFLNTYEIYNMSMNASLAVLSSCRSGYGTLQRGEGVMSLARGFLYSGIPSIVMTNWEIEDKSGAEIMISFYKYLLKGFRKDEALRRARLDFLDNTDMLRSHPYFWGAYVSIGNPDPIFRTHREIYPYLTFAGLMFILGVVLWQVKVRS